MRDDFTRLGVLAELFIAATFAYQSSMASVSLQTFSIDVAYLVAYFKAFASIILLPALGEWWQNEKSLPIYTQSFLDAIAAVEGTHILAESLTGGLNPAQPASADSPSDGKA